MITNGTLHASPYPIQRTGLPVQKFSHSDPSVANFFHPLTQAEIEKMVRVLVAEGRRYKSFKGISFQLYRDGAAWWGDIQNGYNDYIIEAFERDTGLKIPCDRSDPLRGKAYYEWIRANAYDRWVSWRCEKFTEFYAKMAKILIGLPAGEGYYREMQKGAFPHVTCRDEFMESDIGRRKGVEPLSGGWLKETGWRVSTINAAGVHGMRYFSVPLRFGDVLGFTRGCFLICDYGYEPLEARLAQAFRALPPEKMADWPHTSDAPEFVRVRTLEKGGTRWFYAVNTEAKPAKVTFRTPVAVRDTVSGRTHKAGAVTLALGPYELRSFVSTKSR